MSDITNPERGFFGWAPLSTVGDLATVRASGARLVFSLEVLTAYRDRPLDDRYLAALDAGFDRARQAGLKVVLRFSYGDTPSHPDAPLARVLSHIKALGPVLLANADTLLVVQAGFIGAWGEWHSSTHGLTSAHAMREVARALLGVLPADRSVQLRTPRYKHTVTGSGPMSEALAFGPSIAARLGFHNDCALSGDDDVGTFSSAAERQFLEKDSRFVPVGGETCALHPRSDGPACLIELAKHHYTFLNGGYHASVIEKWQRTGVYDALTTRLGYRFELRGVTVRPAPADASGGDARMVSITIENVGFAAPVCPRPIKLVVSGTRSSVVLPVEARRLGPGTHVLQGVVSAPAGTPDTHLGLALPDPSPRLAARTDYAIRVAGMTWHDGVNWLPPALA
jgi:hypothetical protein